MNKTIDALKLAEEALEELHYSSGTVKAVTLYKSALAAIREALAEHEKQEPVAFRTMELRMKPVAYGVKNTDEFLIFQNEQQAQHYADKWELVVVPLYAAPVQPVKQEPVATVNANDEGYWADILPDRDVKVGQLLYAAPVSAKREWVDLTAQEKANIIYAADHRNPMAMLNEALLLLREKNAPQACTHGCDDNACPECYLEHQEPIAKVCHDLAGHIGWNPDLDELPEEGTLLYTTPPVVPQGEPVAHVWDGYGERCIVCGDKDWMASPYCSGKRTTPSVEAATSDEEMTKFANGYLAGYEDAKENAAKLIDNEEIHRGKWFAAAIRSMK